MSWAQTIQTNHEDIEERVFQVAEDYGLDIVSELDEVGVKYLGTYVNARTSNNGKLRIDFDSTNFFKLSEERQRRVIFHELIHVKQFNNSLSDWAEEEFDVSNEVSEKLDGTIWEDVKSVEGETELILSNFFPGQESSYPYAMSLKQKEFEGIDLDEEMDSGVQELEEVVDDYRKIENSMVEDDIYMEEGEFKGVDYTVAVLGADEEEGKQKVEDYLVENIQAGGDEGLSYGEYSPAVGMS